MLIYSLKIGGTSKKTKTKTTKNFLKIFGTSKNKKLPKKLFEKLTVLQKTKKPLKNFF